MERKFFILWMINKTIMTKNYKTFDKTIKKLVELKKDPKVKEYLEAQALLASQTDDLKASITAGDIECEVTDYYTFYETKRVTYNTPKVKKLFGEEFINEKVDAKKLKKYIKDSGEDYDLSDLGDVKTSVAVKCPILSN